MRYLVKRHGIELHQLRAISVGKVALGAGEKASPDPRSRLCPFRRNSCSRRKQQGSMRRPGGGLLEFLKTITPKDLGGKE